MVRAWSLAFCVGLAASTAFAGEQVKVQLLDGSVFVGELVEQVPGDKVVLRLATGEIKVIPWTVIQPQASTAPPPPAAPKPEPMFRVQVQSDRPGTVLQRLSSAGTMEMGYNWGGWGGGGPSRYALFELFSPVCVAPCTATVPSSSIYRIGGAGVVPSRHFSIPMDGARLDVSAGSSGARVGGFVLLFTGIGAVVAGGTIALVGALGNYCPASVPGPTSGGSAACHTDNTLLAAGGITAGVGVVMLVAGIVLIATSGTSVRLGDGTPMEYVGKQPKVRWAGDRLVF